MRKLLNLALGITYFGDYCSLIGLMEYAKRFGGSDKVVSIFVVYGLPPLIMSLVANKWAQKQQHPEKQLAIFSLVGAISGLSLLHTISYAHVLLVTFLLGFVKETTLLLVNVYIKFNFSEDEAKHSINNIVTTRFFIMIFGGVLGSYLGDINMFNWVFLIDAGTFFVAGTIFYFLQSKVHSLPQETKTPSLIKGTLGMINAFETLPFLWSMLAVLGIGFYMGIEYPLITTEFHIAPKLIGAVWVWYIIGSLAARKAGQHLLNGQNLPSKNIFSNLLLIVSFGLMGIFGKQLLLIGFQVGIIAFFMVLSEVIGSYYLMKQSTKEIYPFYNMYFRITNRFGRLIGSIMPLILLKYYSLFTSNIIFSTLLLALGGTLFLIRKMISGMERENEAV